MSVSCSIASFRKYRKWKPEEVAEKLGLSLKSYMDIEKGKVEINNIVAEKLSDVYHAPKEIFIANNTPNNEQAEVIYSNCTFINGTGGSSGYINHQYNDRGIDEILFLRKEEFKKLQQQIEQLQQQNARLIELLGHRDKT